MQGFKGHYDILSCAQPQWSMAEHYVGAQVLMRHIYFGIRSDYLPKSKNIHLHNCCGRSIYCFVSLCLPHTLHPIHYHGGRMIKIIKYLPAFQTWPLQASTPCSHSCTHYIQMTSSSAQQPSLSLSPPCTSQVIFSAHWIFIQQVAGESVTDL